MLNPRPAKPSGIDIENASVPTRVKMPKNQKPLWISNSTWLTKPAANAIVRLAARYSSDRDAYRYFSASVGRGWMSAL